MKLRDLRATALCMITVPSNSTNLKTDASELPPLPWGHTHNHIHLTSTENSCPQTSWALHFLTAETGEVTQVYFTLALFVVVGHLHLLGKLTTLSDSPTLHPSPAPQCLCRSPPYPGNGKLRSPGAFSACYQLPFSTQKLPDVWILLTLFYSRESQVPPDQDS